MRTSRHRIPPIRWLAVTASALAALSAVTPAHAAPSTADEQIVALPARAGVDVRTISCAPGQAALGVRGSVLLTNHAAVVRFNGRAGTEVDGARLGAVPQPSGRDGTSADVVVRGLTASRSSSTPWIAVAFSSGGRPLGRPVVLGRCAVGAEVRVERAVHLAARLDLDVRAQSCSARRSTVTVDSRVTTSSLDVTVLLGPSRHSVLDERRADGTSTATLAGGVTLPHSVTFHGPGGDPIVSTVAVTSDGSRLGDVTRLGRCSSLGR